MKSLPAIIVLLLFIAIPGQALAETPRISPGLWEHSFTMKTRSGLLEGVMGQIASLAPEHMQMMEQAMTNQGLNFGPSGNVIQVCITKEDAARGEVPQIDSSCTQKIVHRSANTIKVAFSCDSDPPTRGEGEITFLNPQAYTGKAVVVTTVQGITEQMNVEQKGRWLAADCGDVAPLGR